MDNAKLSTEEKYRLFAWQGFSFKVPVKWDLAEHQNTHGVSCVRFYDDFSPRLEFEWLQARHPVQIDTVRRRYDDIAASMNAAGSAAENTEDLPPGWSACLYSMPDGKRLMTAFRLEPGSHFFCLLKIFFENAGRREAERLIRLIASSFRLYHQELVPWAVYDISFRLHSDFRLAATSFQAGRKLLVFEWRWRRLYLWYFSLSDILLQKQTMEEWCAGYLNGFKAISGVKFSAAGEGELFARHQLRRLIGNVEPAVRGCLRYRAWCRALADKNQIFLGVLNYRRRDDLLFLESGFEPVWTPDSA